MSWRRASAATANRRGQRLQSQLEELLHAGEIIRNRRGEYSCASACRSSSWAPSAGIATATVSCCRTIARRPCSCRRARCSKRCTATASPCASAVRTIAAGRKARSSKCSSATRARSSGVCTTSPASASWCPTIRASAIVCSCRAATLAAHAPARSCWSSWSSSRSRTAQALGHVSRLLGEHAAPGMETEIAIHSHGLPFEFPREAVAEAETFGRAVSAAAKRGREDLRELPLVTIDGEDARDFDDAVYCEEVRGGWRLLVAIADVASYVRPGLRARQGSAEPRHVGLLPESRPADAARGAVERPVLAESEGRPPVHGLRDARQPAGQSHACALLRRRDVLGGAPDLHEGRGVSRRIRPRGTSRKSWPSVRSSMQLHAVFKALLQAREQARRAGFRRAGAQGALRRRGQDRSVRRVDAQRCAPADRGMHDRRERRGGALPQEAPHADAVPRARLSPRTIGSKRCASSCRGSASSCRRTAT